VRWLRATIVSTGLLAFSAACSDDDDAAGSATLPAIQTTSTIATTVPPTTTQPRFYEVQSGDTLTEIAAAYGLPIPAIMEINGITNPDAIFEGQILELPLASEIVSTSLPPVTTIPAPTALPAVTTVAP
jgi:LysM repeat protein